MTEEEAKTRWCPFVRATSEQGATSWNRGVTVGLRDKGRAAIHDTTRCLGSGCMAWRTRHQWLDNAQEQPGWVSYAPYGFQPGPGQEREDGFCSLMGAPQ